MSRDPQTEILPASRSAGTATTSGIRVVLADDHAIMRDGLRALLELSGDITVAGEARTGREAVEEAERLQPNVMLMDISMPDLDGIEACRRILLRAPAVRVLFLTMHEADEYLFRSLRAGAAGYVIKRTATADLLAAVRAVARGESFLSPSVARALVSEFASRSSRQEGNGIRGEEGDEQPRRDAYDALSSREREVLQLVAEGHTNPEIAEQLHLSVKTVQSHRAAVMEKLELRDVTHLVRYAVRKGLVDPER
jgi:two-component system response regulator NreC